MVHRKSEYRMSYKWLSSAVCRDGRVFSADYRHQRRISDYSHHPWGSTVERCDCEEEGSDEADRYLPLPRNRQKHRMLVDQWQRQELVRTPLQIQPVSPLARGREPLEPWVTPAAPPRTHFDSPRPPTPRIAWKDDPVPQRETTIDGNWPKALGLSTETPRLEPCRIQDYSAEPEREGGFDPRPRNPIPTLPSGAHRLHAEPRFKKLDIAPVVPDVRPGRLRHSPSPNRKTTRHTKSPSIHSYGWANVGGQQTHNVRPKSAGVHSLAHRSQKGRDSSLWRKPVFDIEHLNRSRSITSLAAPINHSSIWMTEYRRNFSRGMQG